MKSYDRARYDKLKRRLIDNNIAMKGKVEVRRVTLSRFTFMTQKPYLSKVHRLMLGTSTGKRNPAQAEADRLAERDRFFRSMENPNTTTFVSGFIESSGEKPVHWIQFYCLEASFNRIGKSNRWLFAGFMPYPTVSSAPQNGDWRDVFNEALRIHRSRDTFPYEQVDNLDDLNWALGVDDFRTYTPPSFEGS